MARRVACSSSRSPAAALPAPAGAAVHRHRCTDAPAGTRCGSIRVPLDRSGAVPGRLTDRVRALPAARPPPPAAGTMLAIEGGPGYSTTDSRDSYLKLLAPLRARRDLLLVDLRGTGPLRRPRLQDVPPQGQALRRPRRAAARARSARGATSTAPATRSRTWRRCSTRCGSGSVDLYGDSYGTFAAQAFAARHGDRLRSLVLDGAYPVSGTDPAFGDLAEATQRALRAVCARRPSCTPRRGSGGRRWRGFVDAAGRPAADAAAASTPRASACACAWTRRRWPR